MCVRFCQWLVRFVNNSNDCTVTQVCVVIVYLAIKKQLTITRKLHEITQNVKKQHVFKINLLQILDASITKNVAVAVAMRTSMPALCKSDRLFWVRRVCCVTFSAHVLLNERKKRDSTTHGVPSTLQCHDPNVPLSLFFWPTVVIYFPEKKRSPSHPGQCARQLPVSNAGTKWSR